MYSSKTELSEKEKRIQQVKRDRLWVCVKQVDQTLLDDLRQNKTTIFCLEIGENAKEGCLLADDLLHIIKALADNKFVSSFAMLNSFRTQEFDTNPKRKNDVIAALSKRLQTSDTLSIINLSGNYFTTDQLKILITNDSKPCTIILHHCQFDGPTALIHLQNVTLQNRGVKLIYQKSQLSQNQLEKTYKELGTSHKEMEKELKDSPKKFTTPTRPTQLPPLYSYSRNRNNLFTAKPAPSVETTKPTSVCKLPPIHPSQKYLMREPENGSCSDRSKLDIIHRKVRRGSI